MHMGVLPALLLMLRHACTLTRSWLTLQRPGCGRSVCRETRRSTRCTRTAWMRRPSRLRNSSPRSCCKGAHLSHLGFCCCVMAAMLLLLSITAALLWQTHFAALHTSWSGPAATSLIELLWHTFRTTGFACSHGPAARHHCCLLPTAQGQASERAGECDDWVGGSHGGQQQQDTLF